MAASTGKVQINPSFNFITQLGLILERNPKAESLWESRTKKERALFAANKKNPITPTDDSKFVSLHSLAIQPDTNEPTRYLFLVFSPDRLPVNKFESLTKMDTEPTYFLSNDYTTIGEQYYVAVVELGSYNLNSKVIFVNTQKKEQSDDGAVGYLKNVDGVPMIALPQNIRANHEIMQKVFNFKAGLSPMIPKAIQALVGQDEKVIKKSSASSNATFLDVVDSAFGNDYMFTNDKEFEIKKGTALYHYSGNATLPKGSHTNTTSMQILMDESKSTTQQNRQMTIEFMQKHPTFDSVTLGTRPPLTVSSKNGIAMARYLSTRNINLSRHVKKIYNIFLFTGNTRNEEFLLKLTELCKRISSSPDCEDVCLLVWSQLPSDVTYFEELRHMDNKDFVDFVTFHYVKNPSFSKVHLNLFTGTDCDDVDRYPELLWEFDLTPLYVNDLLALTEKQENK